MRTLVAKHRSAIVAFGIGLFLGVIAYARLGPDVVKLDPGVQSALLLVVSVTIAATVGAAGAVAGSSIAAGATERAARDTRTAQDRHRFTERKQTLYVDLWLACDQHRREVGDRAAWLDENAQGIGGVKPVINPTEPARRALKALELIAPQAVVSTATALYEANVAFDNLLWWHPDFSEGPPDEPVPDSEWERHRDAWDAAADAFAAAAQADLRNPD
jgi:hypothetical protein